MDEQQLIREMEQYKERKALIEAQKEQSRIEKNARFVERRRELEHKLYLKSIGGDE